MCIKWQIQTVERYPDREDTVEMEDTETSEEPQSHRLSVDYQLLLVASTALHVDIPKTEVLAYCTVHECEYWQRRMIQFQRCVQLLASTYLFFPLATRNPKKHLFVHVYCVCQLPESYRRLEHDTVRQNLNYVVHGSISSVSIYCLLYLTLAWYCTSDHSTHVYFKCI